MVLIREKGKIKRKLTAREKQNRQYICEEVAEQLGEDSWFKRWLASPGTVRGLKR